MENGNVARFVPALPRQLHAQRPRSLRKIDETLSGDVEAGNLVAHVPVNELATRDVVRPLVFVQFCVTANDLEARVACRLSAQPDAFFLDIADRIGRAHPLPSATSDVTAHSRFSFA